MHCFGGVDGESASEPTAHRDGREGLSRAGEPEGSVRLMLAREVSRREDRRTVRGGTMGEQIMDEVDGVTHREH